MDGRIALALVVLLLLSRRGSGMSNGRMRLNPATGKPIVQQGTKHLSDVELRALLQGHAFADVDKAFAIAKRESGGWVDVVVDTVGMSPADLQSYWGKPAQQERSVGLFQINTLVNTRYSAESLKDPDVNASYASALSNGGTTWGPWGG